MDRCERGADQELKDLHGSESALNGAGDTVAETSDGVVGVL